MMRIVFPVSVVLAAAAIAAAITYPTKPPAKPPTFDQRWSEAMQDIYGSQENLRRSGHVSVKTEIICTKKWCDRHPSMEGKPK